MKGEIFQIWYIDVLVWLIFSDGPRFRSKPKIVQADLGSTVTLTCDVDGNPPPDIVWIHKNTEKVNQWSFESSKANYMNKSKYIFFILYKVYYKAKYILRKFVFMKIFSVFVSGGWHISQLNFNRRQWLRWNISLQGVDYGISRNRCRRGNLHKRSPHHYQSPDSIRSRGRQRQTGMRGFFNSPTESHILELWRRRHRFFKSGFNHFLSFCCCRVNEKKNNFLLQRLSFATSSNMLIRLIKKKGTRSDRSELEPRSEIAKIISDIRKKKKKTAAFP